MSARRVEWKFVRSCAGRRSYLYGGTVRRSKVAVKTQYIPRFSLFTTWKFVVPMWPRFRRQKVWIGCWLLCRACNRLSRRTNSSRSAVPTPRLLYKYFHWGSVRLRIWLQWRILSQCHKVQTAPISPMCTVRHSRRIPSQYYRWLPRKSKLYTRPYSLRYQ